MKPPKAKARQKKRARRRDLRGCEYRSMFELDTSKVLRSLHRKCKFSWTYETVKIEYTKPSTDHWYTPDFVIERKDGSVWYLETKGIFDAADRKKHSLIKEQQPDLDIRIFFMRDQAIRKGSKTRYSDWCRKLQIPYCVGKLEMEWFNG